MLSKAISEGRIALTFMLRKKLMEARTVGIESPEECPVNSVYQRWRRLSDDISQTTGRLEAKELGPLFEHAAEYIRFFGCPA